MILECFSLRPTPTRMRQAQKNQSIAVTISCKKKQADNGIGISPFPIVQDRLRAVQSTVEPLNAIGQRRTTNRLIDDTQQELQPTIHETLCCRRLEYSGKQSGKDTLLDC